MSKKPKSFLIIYQHGYHEEMLPEIKKILNKNDIHYRVDEREKIRSEDYEDRDLVIIIGGDGTFLRASHFNQSVPMFGINPNPSRKEGFFMQAKTSNYKTKLKKVLNGDFEVVNLLKLRVKINDRILAETALNDVYIGDKTPYNMFNYDIAIKNDKEFQRGSGLIIGTASGSHAWLKSAGAKVLEMNEMKYQFVARELYEGNLTNGYKIRSGLLDDKTTIEITAKTPGIVVFDSISEEYDFDKGDQIFVYPCEHCVKYVKI